MTSAAAVVHARRRNVPHMVSTLNQLRNVPRSLHNFELLTLGKHTVLWMLSHLQDRIIRLLSWSCCLWTAICKQIRNFFIVYFNKTYFYGPS